jgi:aryl sulfotransferase
MADLPRRTREYIGPVTESRVWDRFELRAGDIILSTPPKCGTTWSQAILVMLLDGHAGSRVRAFSHRAHDR